MNPNTKLLGIILIIFLSLNLSADWQDLDAQGKKNLRSGNLHYNGKRFEKARPLYLKILEDNPEHLESLEKLASIHFEIDKDYIKAHELYNKIVSLIDSVQNKYDSLQATDEDAAKDFYKDNIRKMDLEEKRENAVKFKDYCWTKLFIKGQNEVNEENYEEAIKQFNYVYEIAPDSVKTIRMLAFIHNKIGNKNKSLEFTIKAAEMDPEDDIARTQIANEYFQMEEYQKAIDWYQKASRINPQNIDNYHNLAVVYSQTKNDSGVVATYKKIVEKDPDNAESIVYLSNYLANMGNMTESLKYLEMAHELDPSNEEYLKFLCYRSYQEKIYEKIIDYGQKWFEVTEDKKKEAAQFVYRAAQQVGNKEIEKEYEQILRKMK